MKEWTRLDSVRVPVRVALYGEPDAWRYVIVDKSGEEEHITLGGPGTRYPGDTRLGTPESWTVLVRMADVIGAPRPTEVFGDGLGVDIGHAHLSLGGTVPSTLSRPEGKRHLPRPGASLSISSTPGSFPSVARAPL